MIEIKQSGETVISGADVLLLKLVCLEAIHFLMTGAVQDIFGVIDPNLIDIEGDHAAWLKMKRFIDEVLCKDQSFGQPGEHEQPTAGDNRK